MLKRISKYYKPYTFLLIIDLSAALLLAGADLVFPGLTRYVIDTLIPSGNGNLLIVFAFFLLGLYLFKAFLDYVVGYWGHVLGVNIQRDLRKDLFYHLQDLDFEFYDNTKTGQIMSRIVSDLFDLGEISHHGPEDLLVASVRFIGALIIMLTINVKLSLIVFAVVPIMIIYGSRFRLKLQKSFRASKQKQSIINERVEENITGIRVVKSFTNEAFERNYFDNTNGEFRQARVDTVRQLGLFNSGLTFISNFALIVVLSAGGYFVFNKEISIGEYVAFTLFVMQFLQPLNILLRFMEMYQDGATGFARFLEIIDKKPEIKDAPNAEILFNVKGEVEFNNVGFRYSENTDKVLHKVNLKVDSGETIAIVGSSGAGKTTLCHLIPRFYEIDEGCITIDGKDIRNLTVKSLRSAVGLVQQDVYLFSGTIKENIMYGRLDATLEEMISAAKSANAHEFVCSLEDGYDTIIGERGIKLSGGQKQRIAIARMFLKNPSILILDEATSSLDAKSEDVIKESIKELSKGRTCFIIAHRLATIRHASRIIVLTENGIAEDGSHDELMAKKGFYYSLYSMQTESLLSV